MNFGSSRLALLHTIFDPSLFDGSSMNSDVSYVHLAFAGGAITIMRYMR